MNWDVRLKRLQDNLNLTQESLASTLGITTRTLADFIKPVSEGGREPTGPVQRLVEFLEAQPLSKKPQLNLVIIHGEFRVPPRQVAVATVVEMHAAAGRQTNNEFHYITFEPESEKTWVAEGLLTNRVQPHFFVCEKPRRNEQALDCYFATTAAWLATKAMQRDLAHITIAADADKFWPLAKELKELADVPVTFVREAPSNPEDAANLDKLMKFLETIGVRVANPSGREFGRVLTLKKKGIGSGTDIAFGFISPGGMDPNAPLPPTGAPSLFFSWNHMRKGPDGKPEMEISDLVAGDVVSYAIGMNSEGACATDVALVERPEGAPDLPRPNVPQEKELLDILEDAVSVCTSEAGWAFLSSVGSRIKVLHPDFLERLQSLGHPGYARFADKHPELFEIAPARARTAGTTKIRLIAKNG